MQIEYNPANLAYALGVPETSGVIRQVAEDFQVTEQLAFQPSGEGEHVMLFVRKRQTNTRWLAERIARLAGVKPVDVGYAGLKDRNAMTSQWFSVTLPGKVNEPDWSLLNDELTEVITVTRHHRKLKRGAVRENAFTIVLRDIQGARDDPEWRLSKIAELGVPNYFGEQRFGRNGSNLHKAKELLLDGKRMRDRHKRGLYLSAARSWLFNRVLSERVKTGTWNRALPGDLLVSAADGSLTHADQPDENTQKALDHMDIHPTGPMWGRGRHPVSGLAATLEADALAPCGEWLNALEHVGLQQERRALRLRVKQLRWTFEGRDRLYLQFSLGPGAYATSVLREVTRYVEYRTAIHPPDTT